MALEINQEHLEAAISDLEKGYITSTIEMIKLPIFLKQIKKELRKKDLEEDKRGQLEGMVENNKQQAKGHKESLTNVEQILNEVYKLRTK